MGPEPWCGVKTAQDTAAPLGRHWDTEAVFLQKENHRFPDRNEDAAAERHFQDFHRHHHPSTDRRYRHGGLGFAKNVELRALVGSFDDFVVNE